MKNKNGAEQVEMDYKGALDGCLKRIVAMRYLLYALAAIIAFRLFVKTAGLFLSVPVEMVVIIAALLIASKLSGRRFLFVVITVLAVALTLFYPVQLVYTESRIFFFLFVVLNLFIIDKARKNNRSITLVSLYTFLLWIAALPVTSVLWPVTVKNAGSAPSGIPGVRMLNDEAVISGRKIKLHEVQPGRILIASDGRSVIAGYGDGPLMGIASLPVKKGAKAVFARVGEIGVKLQDIDSKNGNIYASGINEGKLYVLAPDTLKLTDTVKLSEKSFPAIVCDSALSEFVVPDMSRETGGINFFKPGAYKKPWKKIHAGGLTDTVFPDAVKQTLPGMWGMSSINADSTARKYFITYSFAGYLVVVDMDSRTITKIETNLLPAERGTALDADHGTLFLAKPLGQIEYYDTYGLKLKKKLKGRRGVTAIAYDGTRDMLVAADYYRGHMDFIERETGKTVLSKFLCTKINTIAVSADGKVYASCGKGIYEVDPEKFGLKD